MGKAKNVDVYEVGEKYLFRSVTHYWLGEIVRVTPTDLVLKNAGWVADTGRFAAALTSGTVNEFEPAPGKVVLGRGAIVDACAWSGELPRETK